MLADNDSTLHKTSLYFAIKPEIPEAAAVPYSYSERIYLPQLQPLYRPGRYQPAAWRTSPSRTYTIVDSSDRFNPKLFRDIVAVRPGARYNSLAQDLTLSRFINVGAFKFVRNRFEPAQQGDSAILDVHYYLTPYPTKSARVETGWHLPLQQLQRYTSHS